MGENDPRIHALLDKLPYTWDRDDTELARQEFLRRRPAVSRRLVEALWRYWEDCASDRPLFDDPEHNLALALHAKAFGVDLTGVEKGGPLHEAVTRIADPALCGPLMPEAPAWGPRAALDPHIRAALRCALLRAWVAVDEQGPVEVLVVGDGLPEIRQQVVQAALVTSLRINGLTEAEGDGYVTDLIGVGVLRITAGSAGQQPAAGLLPVFGARHSSVPDDATATPRGALRDFVALLRSLQHETELVQVTEVGHEDLVEFGQTIRSLADRACADPAKALLRPIADTGGPDAVVSLLPYLRTAREQTTAWGASVGIDLSADLLTTERYQRLELAHQRVLADRLTMDAMLRRDRLLAEIDQQQTELTSYQVASREERTVRWDPTVLLSERWDEHLGRMIKLAEEEECDTEVYFAKNVPHIIKLKHAWAQRMTVLVDNLQTAVHRPHAPARQLAAGRFVDAVLRDAVPDESPATERAFRAWREDVAAMLWFEWRCSLREQLIDPSDLWTPHTAFVTRYLPAVDGDPAVLFTHAYSLVDEDRSAVLADARRGVLVVRDATDHAVRETAEDGAGGAQPPGWDELVRLAGRADCEEETFDSAFLRALRARPRDVVRRMVEELCPSPPDPGEAATIDDLLGRAVRAASLTEGMSRALAAMRGKAFLTARQCLDDVRGEPRWEARAWLLRAVVECTADEIPPQDIPGLLGGRLPGLPLDADRALDEAAELDQEYTTRWLAVLPDHDLDIGVRRLFHGLPPIRSMCREQGREQGGEREFAVWLFRHAVESARLARQLEEAGEELAEDHEAIDVALAKLGKAVEAILTGPFVGGMRGEAQDLFAMLTGEDPPKYGRAVVR